MSFALMGDLVLCARSSYFLQAFRRIGLVPDGGSTWILPRLVGKARAMELSLLGEKLPAETALQWGLVNRVYDDEKLISEAKALAADLASGPTKTLGMIRQLYWESTDNTYEEQLNLERQLQRTAGYGEDFKEGVRAFLEKRPAQFKGNGCCSADDAARKKSEKHQGDEKEKMRHGRALQFPERAAFFCAARRVLLPVAGRFRLTGFEAFAARAASSDLRAHSVSSCGSS